MRSSVTAARTASSWRSNGQLESRLLSAALFGGFTGIAWTVEHLTGRLLEPDDAGSANEIDEALSGLLSSCPWSGHFDLISGLAGYAVYALERLPRAAAQENLGILVDHLGELVEEQGSGLTWFTPLELMHLHQREQAGLVQMFNRLYQETDDEALGEAARFWIRRTFDSRLPDRDIAGFPAYRPNEERSGRPSPTYLPEPRA